MLRELLTSELAAGLQYRSQTALSTAYLLFRDLCCNLKLTLIATPDRSLSLYRVWATTISEFEPQRSAGTDCANVHETVLCRSKPKALPGQANPENP
ncbi:hypothetical protein VTN49DRAFT_4810 [Thermomyces lanuginosus]|uniref:uncharacterized protein n=1 Tax=Thermomyces lanuginosus TaxID=5541 RepID=UPI0037421DDF